MYPKMDSNIWSNLHEDILKNILYKRVHPFAEEIKTLHLLNDVVNIYASCYGDEAYDWLAIDLDNFRDDIDGNWGVPRKWKKLTPLQRMEFFQRVK